MRRPTSVTIRDPDRTRRAILAAALAEFSARGPAGARVDRIAAAAGVNKRMIYHYFGNKDGLWAGVLDDQWGAEPVLAAAGADSVPDQLKRGARRIAGRPGIARLLAWEALAAAGDESDPGTIRAAGWRDRVAYLRQAQRDGRLSPRLDPIQLELALTALLLFPHVFPQVTRMITGHSATEPVFVRARESFFESLVALLQPESPPSAAPQVKPRFRLTAAVTEVR